MQRPMCLRFKLLSQHKVATLVSGEPSETTVPKLSPSRLLYVANKRNKCRYLIDTGAAGSVLPGIALTGPWTLIVYLWSLQIIRLLQHTVQVNV